MKPCQKLRFSLPEEPHERRQGCTWLTQLGPAPATHVFDFLFSSRSISTIGAAHAYRGTHWTAMATGLGSKPNSNNPSAQLAASLASYAQSQSLRPPTGNIGTDTSARRVAIKSSSGAGSAASRAVKLKHLPPLTSTWARRDMRQAGNRD
jgi:hypothetical protein